jgi:hypothetical protein
MIVGITGKLGSGKTTLANNLIEHKYEEYSFAEPLKRIAEILGFTKSQLYGTQEEKLEINELWGVSGREFLQRLGTEVFRKYIPTVFPSLNTNVTIWAELFRQKYIRHPKNYVISDTRFLDEEEVIRSLGGTIIKTVRASSVSSSSGNEHTHSSEIELERIRYDCLINNDKLTKEKAKQRLLDFLEELKQYNFEEYWESLHKSSNLEEFYQILSKQFPLFVFSKIRSMYHPFFTNIKTIFENEINIYIDHNTYSTKHYTSRTADKENMKDNIREYYNCLVFEHRKLNKNYKILRNFIQTMIKRRRLLRYLKSKEFNKWFFSPNECGGKLVKRYLDKNVKEINN